MKIGDYTLGQIRKSIAAFGVGVAGALGTALLDGDLTQKETIGSLGAGLLLGLTVFKVKNKDVVEAQ